jgi:hypothetical protein
MQAALMLRSKQRLARNKARRQRMGIKGDILPSNLSASEIPAFPQFPPKSWVVKVPKNYFYLTLIDHRWSVERKLVEKAFQAGFGLCSCVSQRNTP